jgi:hypothetical protein
MVGSRSICLTLGTLAEHEAPPERRRLLPAEEPEVVAALGAALVVEASTQRL